MTSLGEPLKGSQQDHKQQRTTKHSSGKRNTSYPADFRIQETENTKQEDQRGNQLANPQDPVRENVDVQHDENSQEHQNSSAKLVGTSFTE